MKYVVSYPHPSIPTEESISLFNVSQDACAPKLCEKILRWCPDYSADLKDATLWKASRLPTDEASDKSRKRMLEWIQGRNGDPDAQEIQPHLPLEQYFPEGTGPSTELGDWVHIVVVTPEVTDLDGNFRRMKARLAFSHSLGEAGPPDNCVRQISTIQEAVENARGPRYGRPSDRYGLPTALFNQELAILKYDLEHLEAFTPDCPTVENAFELVCSSTAFYPERYYREMCVGGIISALLPGGTSPMLPERTADGGVKPLGAWLEGLFAYLIFRQKDEQGLEGDPFLQSLLVYSKMISEKHYAELIPRSNLPIVLLDITGNRLEVSAAIFTNAIYADKLLSIELMLGTHARENVIRVARIFTAISKCATSLQNLYKNLRDSSDQVPGVEFPNPTPDPPGPSEEIRALRFLCKLDRVRGTELITVDVDNERHGIYLAKRSNGPSGDETVLVKFAPRYHATAHRLLADHDPPLAPALYSCTRVIGGMYMVVMEYLQDAKPLDHFFPQYPTPLPPPPDVDVVRRDLTKALDLLHKKDLVFSDLRERNVLYSPKDKGRVFLIDFDAVGEHGKDRHSPCLNTELGLGVGRWQIMEKSHDESNRDRILSWLSTTVDLARRLKAEFED